MQRQVTKRQVQVIQPTINAGFMQSTLAPVVKKRVAAYARVSTEHEEQQTSYEAQVDYYTPIWRAQLRMSLLRTSTRLRLCWARTA